MTFEQLREKLGGTPYTGIDAAGFYTLPEIRLSQLFDVLGPPLEQKVNERSMVYLSYPVDEGVAIIVGGVEGKDQRFEQGLLLLKLDERSDEIRASGRPGPGE
jgi:hypothetical protein